MKAAMWFIVLSMVALDTPAIAQRGGRLIAADSLAQTPAGMQAWRIRYWTTNDRGQAAQVTGMVVAPREAVPSKPRKVIAWTHGTWGVGQQCAPSRSPRFFQLTPALDAVRAGYVVVAPNYPGLGSAGPHPYLVGSTTARSTLDALRAAQQIPGAAAGLRFAVWGESQGGHAALWTGQLFGVEGDGLSLVGIAAGAPPTYLAANFRQASDANARAFLTALAATSWSKYYGHPVRLGRRSTPAIMRRLAANCISVDSTPRIGALLGIVTLRRALRNVDFPAIPPWSSIVSANSTTPLQKVPVLIAQTSEDPLVAPAVTRSFARKLCANRVLVRWIDLPGNDHATTARQSAAETLQWIEERFVGHPAPNDCTRI